MTNLATVAKTFLAPLAASIALYAAAAPLASNAHAQAATTLKAPIYGVTLDDLSNINAIVTSLTKLPYKPTVRVVFDPGTTAAEYYPALVKLHTVANVMGEIMDSYYFPTDINTYTARTKELVYGLNGTVDVWEIANEINGEWLRPNPNGNNTTVNAQETAIGQMVAAANTIVKGVGGKTAITLYYNDDSKGTNCWEKSQDYWKTWPTTFLPAAVRLGADYAFFSYYPYQDCPGLSPSWETDFSALGSIFPNARLGFGEIGTSSTSAPTSVQTNLIKTYYPMVNTIKNPRFVGGFFWWNYAEQMVPYTKAYWTTLNQTIAPLKVPQ
ncbi:hypothetical protein GCM10008098_00800 [Rhodanobacter panaciterrae]|uniref:Transmembrane protein n=1 Tax=Rhodanobacter panaciterrae TaxID=490572 RepID=A0ABQ2ZFM8_9GAMM|nr:hypothetical protein [Rhodanobacter panaciterrae]GGY14005.1 hypothetical protein GCM10008098_00800 [Rhodanobacter panaciterrae]